MVNNISQTNINPLEDKVDKRDPKILEASRMYEQAFLKQMVGAMRQAVAKSDLVKESMAERIYKDQMYDKYVEQWSNVGGVGLGDLIYDQIIERFGPQQNHIRPQGPIPMNNEKTFEVENRSDSQTGAMELRFRPQQKGESLDITSPWEGEVIGSRNLDGGERALFIKHPGNMKSTFVFKGALNVEKNSFGPGETIGTISQDATGFVWKVEQQKV